VVDRRRDRRGELGGDLCLRPQSEPRFPRREHLLADRQPRDRPECDGFLEGRGELLQLGDEHLRRRLDCGHYTQIVWDTTTQVGCAIQACPAGIGSPPPGVTTAWSYVVCDYSPPGNIVGLRPYAAVLAAEVSLSGRVASRDGRGITNAVVTLTGRDNQPHTFITGRSGTFHFDSLAAGETYVVTVQARRFSFDPSSRVYTLNDNVSDADFTAQGGASANDRR